MLTNRAGMRDAPTERGGRNLPMAAGGASSGTARRESTPVRELKNLMEAVVERENMLNAFRRVVGNKGAAGVDAMSVDELKPYLQTHWERIKEQLLEGSYQPQPVRRVEIPKPGGKGMRKLGVPTVVDRLIQQALHQALNPLFDLDFSAHSYGFRSGRSAHQALCQAREHVASGRRWVVDLDLEKFFDRVHHDVLMSRVARKVGDKRVLCLIRRYLQAGIMEGGLVSQPTMGTPQGGPLSPLLSNILLDDLDKELERRGHRFCRYADDVNVYVASRRAGQRVLDSIEKFLTHRLHLRVNRQKSAVDRPWKRKFLGYSMTWHKRPRLKVAPSSVKRLRMVLKKAFRQGRGRNLGKFIEDLTLTLRGWVNYFRLSEVKGIFEELDGWIRRRLRWIIWRQWKRAYARAKGLMRRGLGEKRAWESATNGRGPWWNSGASHMNQAFPKKFFDRLGLVSLLDSVLKFQCNS
ncbi:MAG: group II intron reverse transcriptase/maturase [Deltaproteobacteria bacterium]|nr:group II intron reverse transcriptase/maturase [Deltaproteobacteria bacterium]